MKSEMDALLGSQAVGSEGSFIGCHGTDLLFLNLLSPFRKQKIMNRKENCVFTVIV